MPGLDVLHIARRKLLSHPSAGPSGRFLRSWCVRDPLSRPRRSDPADPVSTALDRLAPDDFLHCLLCCRSIVTASWHCRGRARMRQCRVSVACLALRLPARAGRVRPATRGQSQVSAHQQFIYVNFIGRQYLPILGKAKIAR